MFNRILVVIAPLIGLAATLSAQTSSYPDTFKVDYYSNANTTDEPNGTVRITNVGTHIGAAGDASGNLCAMIYVFSPDQELDECCGCPLTPDGLITLPTAEHRSHLESPDGCYPLQRRD